MAGKTKRRQQGEGALYQRASDGLWMGTLDLGVGADGKRRRKYVTSKSYATAQKKLRELRKAAEDNGGTLPTASMTTGAWLDHWLERIAAPRLRPKTLASYRADVRLHIAPSVGRYRLDRLAPQHVRAMGAEIISKGNSSTSALRCHRVLAKALTDAQREGHVGRNVAALVDAPRKAAGTRGALTALEGVTLLTSVAADDLGSRWAAALLTGARQGELLGLERDRVGDALDLSWQLQRFKFRHGCGATCGVARAGSCPARELDVRPGFEHRPLEGGLVLTRPKTKAGHRVIPLIDPLRAIIERHVEATPPGPHGLVWHRGGHPIDPRDDSAAWHDALRLAGLPPVPLHAARHTAATLLLEAGVDALVITQILGHSSVAVSEGYKHVSVELATDAIRRLSGLLEIT